MTSCSCRVSQHSTIRVKKVVYSVPARLIGQEVRVEVYEGQLKVFHGRELLLLSLARARGERRAVIDYRHVIEHLLRKPGRFPHYVHREEIFPDSAFRLAYDRLVGDHGERAGQLEYLRLLQLAAELGEVSTINSLVAEWCSPAEPAPWRVANLRRFLDLETPRHLPDIRLEPELGRTMRCSEGRWPMSADPLGLMLKSFRLPTMAEIFERVDAGSRATGLGLSEVPAIFV